VVEQVLMYQWKCSEMWRERSERRTSVLFRGWREDSSSG